MAGSYLIPRDSLQFMFKESFRSNSIFVPLFLLGIKDGNRNIFMLTK